MLKDLITRDRIQLVKSAAGWEEAIRLASTPLVADGSISEEYVGAMIDIVNQYGPYIVLAPGIALPHARHESGVNRLAMAFLRVDEKVYFNEEKYANLFFVLACEDDSSHIDALRQMAEIFGDETALDRFLNAKDETEILSILQKTS